MNFLAIDIGASSGRHILGRVVEGKITLEEIYRFDNSQVRRGGHDCWDLESLLAQIIEGIKECGARGFRPESIGIDTWGVDFILLDENLEPCSDSVAYRDMRTEGMDAVVSKVISETELYAKTGIQKMSFNTIYQLAALKQENPESLEKAAHLLMVPEYLNYRLTGKIVHDYTDSSTTGLLNAAKADWDWDLIDRLGLPRRIFGKLSMPGTVIGEFDPEIAKEVGFSTKVVLTATHDTASAYLAVPARDDRSVYISSGTWSLLGVENKEPITTEKSRLANFTNEGGYQLRYRYLRNIMGLWMIQSIRRELNGVAYVKGKENKETSAAFTKGHDGKYSFAELETLARNAQYDGIVRVNEQRFMAPESMVEEVCSACREGGYEVPKNVGELMLCVYRSLARCYADVICELEEMTGKRYHTINIVGGGCRDTFLNELTAEATGLEVVAGPVEGTAIGNLMVQMIVGGIFENIEEARTAVER